MANRLGVPENTLQDLVRFCHVHDAIKHGLSDYEGQTPEEYADARIDKLSNSELLRELSDAIERIRA